MAKRHTLKKIGGSVATVLPKQMLDRLNLGAGDEVYIVERSDGLLITPEHLSPELRQMSSPTTPPGTVTPIGAGAGSASMTVPLQDVTLADALAEVERRMIAEALRKHNGNISRAARELGLTRRGLYLKLERHAMSASA